jgi:hypothetical protein
VDMTHLNICIRIIKIRHRGMIGGFSKYEEAGTAGLSLYMFHSGIRRKWIILAG